MQLAYQVLNYSAAFCFLFSPFAEFHVTKRFKKSNIESQRAWVDTRKMNLLCWIQMQNKRPNTPFCQVLHTIIESTSKKMLTLDLKLPLTFLEINLSKVFNNSPTPLHFHQHVYINMFIFLIGGPCKI